MNIIDADEFISEYCNWCEVRKPECDDGPSCDIMISLSQYRNSLSRHSSVAYECFNCGHISVGWQREAMFEDMGFDGYGVVQNLKCGHCGAEIEYRVALEEPKEVDDDNL